MPGGALRRFFMRSDLPLAGEPQLAELEAAVAKQVGPMRDPQTGAPLIGQVRVEVLAFSLVEMEF
jgi:hypothetical protein